MRFKYAVFGLLATSSLLSHLGCTTADDSADDTVPNPANAGSSNVSHAGSNSGGALGEAGAGGEGGATPAGGSGGAGLSQGGHGGTSSVGGHTSGGSTSGGSASGGNASGGSAGAVGQGGTLGQSGGPSQSAACKTCSQAKCATPSTNGCDHISGDDTAKCKTVQDCLLGQNCIDKSDPVNGTVPCYCGKETSDMCFFEGSASKLSGACTATIETAGGNVSPLQMSQLYYDNSAAVGAANQHVTCLLSQCASDCF